MPSSTHPARLDALLRDIDIRSLVDSIVFAIWASGHRVTPISVAQYLHCREPDTEKKALLTALVHRRAGVIG